MVIGRLCVLLFASCSVNGLKLVEKPAQIDVDESISRSGSFQTPRDSSWEKRVDDAENRSNWSNDTANRSTLDDLADLWNLRNAAAILRNKPSNVSTNCKKDVLDYATAVSTGERWALKMADAAGKYTWGLLSSNVFWLGSMDQCGEMETEFVEWRKDRKAPRKNDVPPFQVTMMAVNLALSNRRIGLNETYNIILGLCLPDSCDTKDVEDLLYSLEAQRGNDSFTEIDVQIVRNLSKGYSFWDDTIFYVLMVTFIGVTFLVVLGTIYDISLRYRVLHAERASRCNETALREMKILNCNGNESDEITTSKLYSVKEHNGTLDLENTDVVPKPLSEALLSFSLLLNVSKLCSFDVGADTLAPIHGLRFISIIWIVLVHTCLTVNVVSENKTFRSNAEKNFLYQTISNGTYAVDTFFFMSGCLVSFLYYRTITKDKLRKKKIIKGKVGKVLQFLGMVGYRYMRLTPPYVLVIGLVEVSMSWFYDHTLITLYKNDSKNCRQFWWRNVLYINTYFAMDERCILWSWYLANDTQFYIIGIIILIIGVRCLPVAAVTTILLLVGSWITTAIIALNTEHIISIQDPFAHYESLYDKPWSRIGPYLLGMMAGWYLYKSDCKMKINQTISLICWVFSFVTMLTIVYGVYGNTYGPFVSAAYTALSHSAWAVAVAWILIACVTGNGGIVNKILSWKYLYPLSRLTYCVYLVHPEIMRMVVLNGGTSMHLTIGLMMILFFGFVVVSYAASLFISLLFEAPMVSLLRIVHPIRQWRKTK